MEREILFRGKSKDGREWLFGDLLQGADTAQIWYVDSLGKWNALVNPETVGQYTGLTDKNGTRIFEGDIVYIDREDERGVVSWDNDGACFEVVIDNISTTFRDNWYGHDLEVIGNIHDNPELMGGDDL